MEIRHKITLDKKSYLRKCYSWGSETLPQYNTFISQYGKNINYTLKKICKSTCHFLVSLTDAFLGDLQELTDKTRLLLHIWHRANCDWLHSQKNSRQLMVMVLLLWQVGLIANIKLHFFLIKLESRWILHHRKGRSKILGLASRL